MLVSHMQMQELEIRGAELLHFEELVFPFLFLSYLTLPNNTVFFVRRGLNLFFKFSKPVLRQYGIWPRDANHLTYECIILYVVFRKLPLSNFIETGRIRGNQPERTS